MQMPVRQNKGADGTETRRAIVQINEADSRRKNIGHAAAVQPSPTLGYSDKTISANQFPRSSSL